MRFLVSDNDRNALIDTKVKEALVKRAKAGGDKKNESNRLKKEKTIELWLKHRRYSYAAFAREFYIEIGVNAPRTIENWLSAANAKDM